MPADTPCPQKYRNATLPKSLLAAPAQSVMAVSTFLSGQAQLRLQRQHR